MRYAVPVRQRTAKERERTLVEGAAVAWVGLQAHVPGGQDEGEGGQDGGVEAADGREQVGPAQPALAQLEAVGAGPACLPHLGGRPSRRGRSPRPPPCTPLQTDKGQGNGFKHWGGTRFSLSTCPA